MNKDYGKRITGAREAIEIVKGSMTEPVFNYSGDVYHAHGVTRELRNMILDGKDPAGAYAGVEWLYKEGSGQPGGI